MAPEPSPPNRSPQGLLLTVTLLVSTAVVISLLLWIRSFEGPDASTSGPQGGAAEVKVPRPIGADAYEEELARTAGTDLRAARLVEAAEAWSVELERLMAETAAEIEPESDWRTVFRQLLEDHPAGPEEVLESYRREIALARAAVEAADLVPLPSADVEVAEIHNPIFRRYFSLAMYLDGRLAVTVRPAEDGDDPGRYLRNHCRVCIPPLAVHEVYPGHHVAYSRASEHVADRDRLTVVNRRQVTYHEGWALYGEQLMVDEGYYREPDRRLGALRMLYLRALRAAIDPALHRGELSREEAERRFVEEGLMTPEAARSEVDRHLKDPVLKATYFIGLRQILELRRLWRAASPDAPLKDFHELFLAEPRPIPAVAEDLGYPLERPI